MVEKDNNKRDLHRCEISHAPANFVLFIVRSPIISQEMFISMTHFMPLVFQCYFYNTAVFCTLLLITFVQRGENVSRSSRVFQRACMMLLMIKPVVAFSDSLWILVNTRIVRDKHLERKDIHSRELSTQCCNDLNT